MPLRQKKLAQLQHEEWLAHRPKATDALIAEALQILDRPTAHPPADHDRLPAGYVPIRRKSSGEGINGRRKG
jgi:hypothetical protein